MAVRLGDAANIFVLVNTVVFLALVVAEAQGLSHIFSSNFRRDGFCVSWSDAPLNGCAAIAARATVSALCSPFRHPGPSIATLRRRWMQSHAACFYADTLLALALLAFCTKLEGSRVEGLDQAKQNVGGVIGHGLGHFFLFFANLGDVPAFYNFEQWAIRIGILIGMTGFWYGFFAANPSSPGPAVNSVHAAVQAYVVTGLVPPKFSLTYVQTVLLLNQVYGELRRADKGPHYDRWSLIVNLPIGLFGWLEALSCDGFLINYGGHLWYDSSIPLSMLVYCATCAWQTSAKRAKAA